MDSASDGVSTGDTIVVDVEDGALMARREEVLL